MTRICKSHSVHLVYWLGMAGTVAQGQTMYWRECQGLYYSGSNRRAEVNGGPVQTVAGRNPQIYQPNQTVIDPVEGKVYWSDYTLLRRANLDGSNIEEIPVPDFFALHEFTLDVAARKIYYASISLGMIRRSNLDGSGVEEIGIFTGGMYDLDLDPDGKIYYHDGTNIRRSNFDGSAVETLISAAPNCVSGLDADPVTGKMYWTDRCGLGHIRRANLNGSGVETLISSQSQLGEIKVVASAGAMYWISNAWIKHSPLNTPFPTVVVTAGSAIRTFALEAASNAIVWSQSTTRTMGRADFDGGNAVEFLGFPWTPLVCPINVALDLVNEKMYWVNNSSTAPTAPTGESVVARANLDGSGVEIVVSQGNAQLSPVALDVSSGKVYWLAKEDASSSWSTIRCADFEGGNLEVIVTAELVIESLYVDSDSGKLYWGAQAFPGGIYRANLDGSQIEIVLTSNLMNVRLTAEPGTNLLFWTGTDPLSLQHKIKRAALDGTSTTEIVDTDPHTVFDLVLDADRAKLYSWKLGDVLRRSNFDGTQEEGLTQFAEGVPTLYGLALDPRCCRPYGDIVPVGVQAMDCLIDVDDLQFVLGVIIGSFDAAADIAPCGGNSVIDVDDIVAVLGAFTGEPLCETTCP